MLNPPRLPEEVFSDLHFLPDPVLNDAAEYKDLDEVYGTITTDKDRPSLRHSPQATDADKENKKHFVAGITRNTLLQVYRNDNLKLYASNI